MDKSLFLALRKEKKGVLNRFLETISIISDKTFQERIWIKGLGSECSDFDETICDFFDNGEDIMSNSNKYNISNSQYQLLLILCKRIKKFSDNTPERLEDKIIISDSEWYKIQEMAKEVLEAFNYKK